jgi:hypothetical protein
MPNLCILLAPCSPTVNKDAALRLLKKAVEQNYCVSAAPETNKLLEKLRGTPEFTELLIAAKQCQSNFLAGRYATH